jgi:hypothetical protein
LGPYRSHLGPGYGSTTTPCGTSGPVTDTHPSGTKRDGRAAPAFWCDAHLARHAERPATRGIRGSAVGFGIAASSRAASASLTAHCTSERRSKPTPASEICGFPDRRGDCWWRLPCIHENALLRVNGPDDGEGGRRDAPTQVANLGALPVWARDTCIVPGAVIRGPTAVAVGGCDRRPSTPGFSGRSSGLLIELAPGGAAQEHDLGVKPASFRIGACDGS